MKESEYRDIKRNQLKRSHMMFAYNQSLIRELAREQVNPWENIHKVVKDQHIAITATRAILREIIESRNKQL